MVFSQTPRRGDRGRPLRKSFRLRRANMRRAIPFAALLLMACSLPAQQQRTASFGGFSHEAQPAEDQWEQKFRALPSPDNLRDSMKLLSAHPHHVGSPYDKQNADWLAAKFKEWGWDVRVETFQVLFPTPAERTVELVDVFVALRQELRDQRGQLAHVRIGLIEHAFIGRRSTVDTS